MRGEVMLARPGDDPHQELLFQLAHRFREAILRSNPRTSRLATLREFPAGACGDASLLLAKYLQVNGCGRSHYMAGKRKGRTHAWLQLADFTIDITADQFEDQDAGVIVSADSLWHSSFEGKIQSVADFCLYDKRSAFELATAYEAITGCL
ncbi:hypothetical protein GPEL0_01f5115 [Geoanaerobacter pelophilus]|uniref:Transglutaminase-like superfamily protein n=1 Tax=Geoanaerobacter pelophilus TaxID=60036 RepID=A0ABQ0MNL6_9BACT|nr:hypothetical protein [Geoanaerobacter pelophilus]GAW68676.1 hypothetical protein GPEL0_01f5115 [Geoanaerobacter pelophilus]